MNIFFFLNFILFIYFWLCWVFVAVRGLLIAVASLVAEHGALGARASVVVVWALERRLSSCGTPA